MLRLDGSTPGIQGYGLSGVGALPASAGKILQAAACNLLDDHWQALLRNLLSR